MNGASDRLRVVLARALRGRSGDVAQQTSNRPAFWLLAAGLGIAAGYAAILFRLFINLLETLIYGATDATIHSRAAELDPVVVVLIPIAGGLAVGYILSRFNDGARALSVADVIHAATLRDARVNRREGLASAAASMITLSTGGSTGREGPVVHLAAVISSWVSDRLRLHGVLARDVLGCAVAAAVSASFNAPIAGALFALEVVLRHYAVHAFGPIVLASVMGTVVSRLHMGNVTEFTLPDHNLVFYAEIPAFMLLGMTCGLVAVAMIRSVLLGEAVADKVQAAIRLPAMLRPAVAGAGLGAIAIYFPHIIGVGYETTSRALTLDLDFWACVTFAVIKVAAVTLTFAGKMGGGMFSPALMLGALTGAAFGQVSTGLIPGAGDSAGLYALAGMGAVAAAVLGAPISTTLIVFEMTGDYQTAIAVMVAVSLATVVAHRFVRKSFFLTQLSRAGVSLTTGPHLLMRTVPIRGLVRDPEAPDAAPMETCETMVADGRFLRRTDSLARALPVFERDRPAFLPVVEGVETPRIVGALFHLDALEAFNRLLVETYREEHS
jgi:CIC family chloride channel protein